MFPLILGLGALAILSACTSDEGPARTPPADPSPREPNSPAENLDQYRLEFSNPSLLRLHRDLRRYGVSQRRMDIGMVVYSLGRPAVMLSENDHELQSHEMLNAAFDMAEENPQHAGFQALAQGLRASTELQNELSFALTHSPGDPRARIRRMEEGVLLMEHMRDSGSVPREEQASFLLGLGDAYYTLGDLEVAERNFRLSSEADPQRHDSAYMLAFTLLTEGRWQEAQSWRDTGFERHRLYSTEPNYFETMWQHSINREAINEGGVIIDPD